MFDEKTITQLDNYVYMLIDPANDLPFYVGKGKANRVFDHLQCALENELESDKYDKIRRIVESGQSVKHIIVRHGLSEKSAFEIESSLIDTFKFISICNQFVEGNIYSGHNSIEKGLMNADEIIRIYNAETLFVIGNDCLIININKTYKRGNNYNSIYNATKEIWDIKEKRRNQTKYVLSEYKGLIVEVFEIENWYPKMRHRGPKAKIPNDPYTGWGFNGKQAEDNIRSTYLNKSIKNIKPRGYRDVLICPDTFENWLYKNRNCQ